MFGEVFCWLFDEDDCGEYFVEIWFVVFWGEEGEVGEYEYVWCVDFGFGDVCWV